MASGGPQPDVAVAVRPGGSGSSLAARWVAAATPCDGRAATIAVVHVIPPLSYVPSPTGERVPVALVGREAAKAYARDRRARAEEALLPFRRLCGRANVTAEAVVVERDGVAEALLRYAQDSGVRSLVLGSASFRWFRRVLSIPDVPSTVLQATQNSCNVFVVSKRKLIMKLTRYPQTGESSSHLRIESISHEAFAQTHRTLLFDNFTDDETYSDSFSQVYSSYSASNAVPSSESCEQVVSGSTGVNESGTEGNKSYDALSSLGEAPYSASNSSEECQSIDEVAKLRKELRETLVTYDKACEDLVHAKKKIQVLSTECSEEARKVEHALEWEEALKQVVADEKAKQLEVINQVEKAKRSFTREAYSRHKAEMAATMISVDKAEIVDAILSKSKRCRRYSKKDIELATDNFSEERKIGEGGYGYVYRCTLDHTEVAVKVIQQDSIDKTDEFLKEVEILSRLQHPNLVLLLGFCPEIGCLVYEYLKNGSLEDQLFNNKGQQPLHWFLRFHIIFEVSCGLAFLHSRNPEPIVHRDLKPANILLDKNYVGKIGDVGFAKLISDLVPDWQTEYRETIVAGTLYYMDPEYQQTGTVRPKSDVFALGVVILQLLTGRRPNGLIVSAENAIRNGRLPDILAKFQTDWPAAEAEMLTKLGLRCTALKCRDRPDLESEVLPKLDEILHRITSAVTLRNPMLSVPSHFICPITQELMEDPHVAADGHTYEHYAIRAWLKRHKTSPVTRCKLPHSSIIPNHSLRATIQQWKSQLSAQAKA
ncbi:U-box domain-containing protein 34-like [Phragmites australis]|uniref:U-box domain-containing protein 34-like n=1 Tax=Phragmites australis TaxID=29695 RepID=UPI002D77AD5E|nr:U-box domain-containing protein 34-like [Phragmites australis]XP_062218583.1 U-box domain-containing protein 34-like [Phragmites australis]